MLDEREGDVPAGRTPRRPSTASRSGSASRSSPPARSPTCCCAWRCCGRCSWSAGPDYAPVVGQAEGIAAEAGLQRGDTRRWRSATAPPRPGARSQLALLPAALDRARRRACACATPTAATPSAHLRAVAPAGRLRRAPRDPGHRPVAAPPACCRPWSAAWSPAAAAWGVLAEGDRITALDGKPVTRLDDVIAPMVQALGERGGPAMVEVERDGERLALEITPRRIAGRAGRAYWALGIASARRGAAGQGRGAALRAARRRIPAAVRETGTRPASCWT